MINRFIKKDKPFAILRYKARIKGSDIEDVRYEIMYLKGKVIWYQLLNQDVARGVIRKHKLPKVVDKDYGVVYEFGNFKETINKSQK